MFWERLIICAKFVNGPLVNTVTLALGFSDFTIDFQTSKADGCLSSGLPVSLGAPNFTEFSAVYLGLEKITT